jgi:lipid-A-disaccharide synthase
MTKKKILMVAGEASADKHASALVRVLKERIPDVEIFGMGGPEMESSGMECCYSMDELSVMGFSDVLPKIQKIIRIYKGIKDLIRKRNPDVVIPVDLPDFNMRVAKAAKKNNAKVLYYIAPQAWAWRKSRAHTLSKITDGLAVIFPFEENFFRAYGVNTRFVGHPLMENAPDPTELRWPPQKIALLPGSRYHEIERILPVMLGAKRIIQNSHRDISWYLPVAPGLDAHRIMAITDSDVTLTDKLPQVDLAMVKSGTSSFEMAIQGVPEVICYLTSPFNYHLARLFVKTRFIGMPNIIMQQAVVPELIQDELSDKKLSDALLKFIQDRSLYDSVLKAFKGLRQDMGNRSASQEVARWVTELL